MVLLDNVLLKHLSCLESHMSLDVISKSLITPIQIAYIYVEFQFFFVKFV